MDTLSRRSVKEFGRLNLIWFRNFRAFVKNMAFDGVSLFINQIRFEGL